MELVFIIEGVSVNQLNKKYFFQGNKFRKQNENLEGLCLARSKVKKTFIEHLKRIKRKSCSEFYLSHMGRVIFRSKNREI